MSNTDGPGTEANRISDRLSEALSGSWSYLRVHGSEASLNKHDLEALLDKLDEAIRGRDKARATADGLREEMNRKAVVLREARSRIDRLAQVIDRAAQHVIHCENIPAWEGALDAGVGAMRRRIEDLEAEVEQLRAAARLMDADAIRAAVRDGDLDGVSDLEAAASSPGAKNTHPQAVINTVRRAQGEDHGEPGIHVIDSKLYNLSREVDGIDRRLARIEELQYSQKTDADKT